MGGIKLLGCGFVGMNDLKFRHTENALALMSLWPDFMLDLRHAEITAVWGLLWMM